jgi:large conductance mechanosensitive channel
MATPNPVDLVKQAIAFDPAQKALSFVDEFRKFALERNVMDLAVGVIIGAAVGKLVESMVKHIMMPLIGTVLPGEESYLGWKWSIGGQEIRTGQFIGELLNFLIVALALFVFIVKFSAGDAGANAGRGRAGARDAGGGAARRDPGSAEAAGLAAGRADQPMMFTPPST